MPKPISTGEGFEFSPILARTRARHRPIAPVAYDCIRLVIVRDGSAFMYSEFGERAVNVGDVVLLGTNVLCGIDPDPQITDSTIYIDPEYALDQLYWQYASVIQNRLDAKEFADTVYTDPAQILRLGEDRVGLLIPWVDELVRLSMDPHGFNRRAPRMQALWFLVLDIVAPFVRFSPVRTSPLQRASTRPTEPRHRKFCPLRAEARQAAEMMKDQLDRQWRLADLAAATHLSPSRFSEVFTDAFGKTPHACLTMLRIEKMARLLRDTDAPIDQILRQVGWSSRGHAARLFRQAIGMSPSRYRAMRRADP